MNGRSLGLFNPYNIPYVVTIKTGKVRDAATYTTTNNFKRGQKDVFKFLTADVGPPKSGEEDRDTCQQVFFL